MYTPLSQLDDMFTGLYPQAGYRDQLAEFALSRGVSAITNKDYTKAVTEFRRAIAYKSDFTDAFRDLGRTFVMMGRTDDAIDSYQKAVKSDPGSEEVRTDLAKTYMINKRYAQAEEQFKEVVRLNPNAAGARASLGYIYMNTGRLDEAQAQFETVSRLAPRDAASFYSLGLLYEKQGRHGDAVRQYETALNLRPDYAAAHADLARSLAATGDSTAAEQQVNLLWALGTDESRSLANQVSLEMYTPKIAYADVARSTFNPVLGPQCPVALLDPSLATPGASKVFSMVLQFNQAMDLSSVQNVFNWSITRADGGTAGVYNYGATLHPDKEIGISPIPVSVSYDPLTHQATVCFTVRQNDTGDGVMDPSHWVFKFTGTDVSGHGIDPLGDQYSGSARVGF